MTNWTESQFFVVNFTSYYYSNTLKEHNFQFNLQEKLSSKNPVRETSLEHVHSLIKKMDFIYGEVSSSPAVFLYFTDDSTTVSSVDMKL